MPTPVRQDRSLRAKRTSQAHPQHTDHHNIRCFSRFWQVECVMVCLPTAPRRKTKAPLEAAVPVANHEFSKVVLPLLERFASVALEAHSERNGVHRPVQLQLMGKLSPGEDDHPKVQRAQYGHTLRIRRAALFIKMVRAVVFNPRTARRRIYVNLEIPGLCETLELVGNIDYG